MKKRRRKIRTGRLLLVIIIPLLLMALLIAGAATLFRRPEKEDTPIEEILDNRIDYSLMQELDLDLYSDKYLLMRLNDLKVLYGKNIDEEFYPASLTKLLTLDAVLSNTDDLEDTSSFSQSELDELIVANASLAGLEPEKEYTVRELLYALVLPSGADAARALENYFRSMDKDLVNEMNRIIERLSLRHSHFTNTTGLHDNDLYTSLDDYARILIDTLEKDEAKSLVKSLFHELDDGTVLRSTLSSLGNNGIVEVYGGKTGFTGEAGENIVVFYSYENRSYMLILAGAPGNPYMGENYHFSDVTNIFKYLYN
ncbi:MAG: D-alanyl-D-alanine carboxypeptidase [Erysipelotrichaceae bacterium]|nr:D-alanyl-D-alanine carboxypeptidase [Erysipelotrichaceae bacterium]